MTKVVLNNITSGYASVSAINANNDIVEVAFENTLSRDGTTPNTMAANLDMNGFSIVNQGNPITVTGFNWEGSWLTATSYQVGDVIEYGGTAYICIVAHTSGTFATDLAALKWQLVATASLPTQTGHSGEVLTTDGSTASWGTKASLSIASSGANSDITSLAPTGLIDLSSATAGQIKFPATQNVSANVNTLDDYDEYTAASAACTGAITTAAIWKLTKVGNVVTLTLPAVSGTASGTDTSFTFGTAIPAKYRPSADLAIASACITNNGATVTDNGVINIISASGAIKIYKDPSFGNVYLGAATAGLAYATSVSWTI